MNTARVFKLVLPIPNANITLRPELDITKEEPVKVEPTVAKSEPLAPPPRPEPSSNAPDYFSGAHSTAHLATEQNPFESSFAGGSSGFTTNINGEIQTPGGTKLPSVNELTSPAGLSGVTPSFWGSLRAGPLSPAMLSGPAKDDYFSDGHHLRGSFPTPNESGLRSGLTPGGSGSMFPEPSPNTFLSQLVSGVATPTTLDFQRTAEHAQAARQAAQNITSQPQTHHSIMQEPSHPKGQFEVNQHDENNAANALYLLQARNNPTVTQQQQQPSHYEMAPRIPIHAHPSQQMNMANHPGSSPQMSNQHNGHNNGSVSTTSGRGVSEMSDENEQQSRPNTRQKGKRTSTQITQTNGRRKVDEAPPKPASKKAKANNGHAMEPEPQSEEELDMNKDEYNANGKKMTDDEKRKNFLERNRYAWKLTNLGTLLIQ